MKFYNFLKKRQSVREFKPQEISNGKMKKLKDEFKNLESNLTNIEFILFENGEEIYNKLEGLGGYSGVMIKAPHYIGLKIEKNDDDTIINSSYYMEKLITELAKLNLGSCWINLGVVPKEIISKLIKEKGTMNFMIAFGIPRDEILSKVTNSEGLNDENLKYLNTYRYSNELKVEDGPSTSKSSRMAIEDIVFKEKLGQNINMDELDQRGLEKLFYYTRYAPSNKNTQPWRFIVKNDKISLAILNPDHKENLTDAGIVMYYFEKMAYDLGFNGKWKLKDSDYIEYDNNKYKIVAEFNI
ncbi:MAG: hypothetical protein FH753_01525 [Firmicutes bacterium]|nr:hypothetical protein [Bacillota bacterium]